MGPRERCYKKGEGDRTFAAQRGLRKPVGFASKKRAREKKKTSKWVVGRNIRE